MQNLEKSERIYKMNRIAIIGSSGSGKSHLAQDLCLYYELPLVDLDQIILDENFEKYPLDTYRDKVQTEASKEKWIIEGVYPKIGDIVWPSADAVIWLNLPFDSIRERYDLREESRNRTGPFPDVAIHKKEYAKLTMLYPEMIGELTINKLVEVTDPNYTLEEIIAEL